MERTASLTDQLYRLEPGETLVFESEKSGTISRLIQRVKGDDRKYICRTTPNGYQVWRTE
jgi:hypothetical protein